jgi:uncharacterized SAM-binding protein YcdF (DUF218 family)
MVDTTTKQKSDSSKRQHLAKRILLTLAGTVELASYYVLTNARYEGQGLTPQFFRFSDRSDIFSNILFIFTLLLIIRAIQNPARMSYLRTKVILAVGIVLLLIVQGIRDYDVITFPRIAIIYLLLRSTYVALLLPRKEFIFSQFSGLLRVLRNCIFILISALVLPFIFTLVYEPTSDFNELRHYDADAGVILGAAVWHSNELGERASPTFLERIKIGELLLRQNVIPKLVTTGASDAPKETSEGEIAKLELVKRGIDGSRITAETSSHSTLQQILYLRDELSARQGWKKFIIISDQYHLARAIEMSKFNGVDAVGCPSGYQHSVVSLIYSRIRESIALLAYWLLGK